MEERTATMDDKICLDVRREIAELDKIAEKLNEMDKTLKEEGLKFSDAFDEPIKI